MLQGTTRNLIITLPDTTPYNTVLKMRVDIVKDGVCKKTVTVDGSEIMSQTVLIKLSPADTLALEPGLYVTQIRVMVEGGAVKGFKDLPFYVRELASHELISLEEEAE